MLNSRRVNYYQNDGLGNYYQNISFHLYVKKFTDDNNDTDYNDGVVLVRSSLLNHSDKSISPLIVTNSYDNNNNNYNNISSLNSNNNSKDNSINNNMQDNTNNINRSTSNNDDNGERNNFNSLNQVPLISTKTRHYFSDLKPFTDLLSFNSIVIEMTRAFFGVVHPLGKYE